MTSALVIGCADCVWDDVRRAQKMWTFDKIYCVKLAGVEFKDRFDVWVTLHPEWMNDYENLRKNKKYPGGYEIVCPPASEMGPKAGKGRISRFISYRWPKMNASASSGIYGAKCALDDGHNRVVLAGIPMTKDNHFTRGTPWNQRESFMIGYRMSLPFMKGKVRSMSGVTKEDLGEPTPEWLRGDPVDVNSVQAQG